MAAITCARCGKENEALESPPMGGQIGATIQEKICADCWTAWVSQQALLINHYGLQMVNPEDRKKLIQVMKEFLNLEPAG